MTNKTDKWSTPPIKAAWFEDGEDPSENSLKAESTPPTLLAEQMTVAAFFDLLSTTDEPPTS